MLSVVSHIEVFANNGALPDWRAVEQIARRNPQVVGAAPYINAQALLTDGERCVACWCAASIRPPSRGSRRWRSQVRGAPLTALARRGIRHHSWR